MSHEFAYQQAAPAAPLAAVVDSYWQLRTTARTDKPIWLLPDGRIDVLFSQSPTEPFGALLMGLVTAPDQTVFGAETLLTGVSLRLPAAEYLLHTPVADLVNGVRALPPGFWGIGPADLQDFNAFCHQMDRTLPALLTPNPDPRKRRLFEALYAADGTLPVAELARRAAWSSRQINRYFQTYFGLSLKAYCGILRFRAAFPQLRAGRLFPDQHFTDQAHFIREVRRLAGVTPKALARNEDGRFIQFSV